MKLKVFISDSFHPQLNLATEEWIFHNLDPSQQVLFLWRNEETVVIGRNQNPWNECNLAKMKEDKVHLARRTTGGGAVFHDLGNTNFTLLSPKDSYSREANVKIILEALKTYGIHGEASGRNDLLIPFEDGPRKFSGSAYREKRDRAFHHGTLLIKADLTRLGNYLTPNPKKMQSKGKESVRARVANLTELNPQINHEDLCKEIIRSFEAHYDAKADIVPLNLDSIKDIPELKQQYELLSSWEWLYGHTLEFTHRMDDYFSLGFFDFQFKVDDAKIKEVAIYTDCLYPQLIESLQQNLIGKPYTSEGLDAAFSPIIASSSVSNELIEIKTWLTKHFEI